jgi:hypothetical protein
MLVTTWYSAIASRLMPGCPNDVTDVCWVISWPSRLSWKFVSPLMPGVSLTVFAVIPGTIIDSCIQFRPEIGSCSICRRSMLPATRAVRRSTSGDSLVTVTLSSSVASFIVKGTWAFWPTRSSISLVTTAAKPASSTLAS